MDRNFAVTARPHANRDLSQTLSGSQSLGHLRQNRKGYFRRAAGADGKAHGSLDAGQGSPAAGRAPKGGRAVRHGFSWSPGRRYKKRAKQIPASSAGSSILGSCASTTRAERLPSGFFAKASSGHSRKSDTSGKRVLRGKGGARINHPDGVAGEQSPSPPGAGRYGRRRPAPAPAADCGPPETRPAIQFDFAAGVLAGGFARFQAKGRFVLDGSIRRSVPAARSSARTQALASCRVSSSRVVRFMLRPARRKSGCGPHKQARPPKLPHP